MTLARRKLLLMLAAAGMLAIVVAGGWYALTEKGRIIEGALAYGRLADLPASAREIEAATVGNMFARSFWMRFDAEPAAIEEFVANSPGLRGSNAITFSSNAELHAIAEREDFLVSPLPDGSDTFRFRWFDPAHCVTGRVLEIPWDAEQTYGYLVIDDATGTIFLYTAHS
jgi:hypothetical protein